MNDNKTLNDYVFIERLGTGSFGEVWKVQNKQTGQILALKIVNVNAENVKESRNELVALENISRPQCNQFVVCYYGHSYDYVSNKLLIEMEYIEGLTLNKWRDSYLLQRNTYQSLYENLLKVTYGVSQGLAYVHEKGLIHRDIKPENIIITPEGIPKIIDFGLTCTSNFCQVPGRYAVKCCKGSPGTPVYMAPETILNRVSYFASDVWSLGATMFTTAAQEYPFDFTDTNNIESVIQDIVSKSPYILSTSNVTLNHIVNQCLIKNPESRITIFQIIAILSR